MSTLNETRRYSICGSGKMNLSGHLKKERAQAVDSFREKYVHGEAMEADFEAMVNAIWNDDYEAHVLMFLYGAGEREKMLS